LEIINTLTDDEEDHDENEETWRRSYTEPCQKADQKVEEVDENLAPPFDQNLAPPFLKVEKV
jgi:hypothetical protein